MEGQAMSEHEEKQTADVLRTKRLEIVDDEGKVRAALGTDEAGVTSLSLFDQSQRLRARLDASEVPEQMNGLGIFDTNGRLQVALGAWAISEKGSRLYFNGPDGESHAGLSVDEKSSSLYCCDTNGENRSGFGVYEDGHAGLRFSAAQNDR
jgi:hypothetical protein